MAPKVLVEGKYTLKSLVDTAERVVIEKTEDTTVLDLEAENRIPKFRATELSLGRILGRGGYCVVNEITKIKLLTEETTDDSHGSDNIDDEHAIHNIVQNRGFMEAHCLRGKGNDCRYAFKCLQHSCLDNAHTYINGVVDLAIEARFLSVIRHPNIIKMRAMASTSPYSLQEPFFVVLDRLYDTLATRLVKWKKKKPTGMLKLLDRRKKKELSFWLERVTVAYDLACALLYLHDLNIVYRDLKPDNIGFDVRGDVKIFDFGLAREFNPFKQDDEGCYNLTGDTGSPRYMAPEVALNKPYNESVDVYSFCILFWQILQLETPFEGCTVGTFHNKVVMSGYRPVCDPKWPAPIVTMIQTGWGEAYQRPLMLEVAKGIREEIGRYSDVSDADTLDASRKSEGSLRAKEADAAATAVAAQRNGEMVDESERSGSVAQRADMEKSFMDRRRGGFSKSLASFKAADLLRR